MVNSGPHLWRRSEGRAFQLRGWVVSHWDIIPGEEALVVPKDGVCQLGLKTCQEASELVRCGGRV